MRPHPLAKSGQIWVKFGQICNFSKIVKIWVNYPRFWVINHAKFGQIWVEIGQNQNLASPKTFDLLLL